MVLFPQASAQRLTRILKQSPNANGNSIFTDQYQVLILAVKLQGNYCLVINATQNPEQQKWFGGAAEALLSQPSNHRHKPCDGKITRV